MRRKKEQGMAREKYLKVKEMQESLFADIYAISDDEEYK